jgi:hypothetical protein
MHGICRLRTLASPGKCQCQPASRQRWIKERNDQTKLLIQIELLMNRRTGVLYFLQAWQPHAAKIISSTYSYKYARYAPYRHQIKVEA